MSNPFTITTTTNSIRLEKRLGEISFTVFNASGRPIDGRAKLVPENPASEGWLKIIVGETEREFPIAGTEQFKVRINVPSNASAGSYSFRLDMVGVENPDEQYTMGPSVTFEVPQPSEKKKFPWWILGVVAGVVIAAAAAAIFIFWPRSAVVPQVAGMSVEEARDIIESVKLVLGDPNFEESETLKEGLVIRTDPPAEEKVKKGAEIKLIISAGQGLKYVVVPQVAGKSVEEARDIIESAKLVLGEPGFENSNSVEEGHVIRTTPPADQEVTEGTDIEMVVSSGPKGVVVPQVARMAVEVAWNVIENANLLLGDPVYEKDNTVGEGLVIKTIPPAGSKVKEGDKVRLVISSGPKLIGVPKVEGRTVEDAKKIIENAKLVPGDLEYEHDKNVKEGRIIRTKPSVETKVKEGEKVTLVISSGLRDVLVPRVAEKTVETARMMIEEEGLVLGDLEFEHNKDVKEGRIIKSVPAAGEKVKEGTKVSLIISSGLRDVVVPNVTGKTLDEAKKILEKVELTLGASSKEYSDSVKKDSIIKTSPAADTKVNERAIIKPVVSLGPKPAEVKTLYPVADTYWDAPGIFYKVGQVPKYGQSSLLTLEFKQGVKTVFPKTVAMPRGPGLVALNFNIAQIPKGMLIEEAILSLYLHSADGATFNVSVHPATSAWNEKSADKPNYDTSLKVIQNIGKTAGRYNWDITEIVKRQYAGNIKNFGICLVPEKDIGWRKFYSREAKSALQPFLKISYRPGLLRTIQPLAPVAPYKAIDMQKLSPGVIKIAPKK